MVGLGQAEAADDLAGREPRQVFAPLRLGAVGVDRIHHQRRLHREHRAIAGIDPLDLARDQPVGDIAEPGAAIVLRQRRAEQPERAHLGHDLAVEALLAKGGEHARKQLLLRIAARGVAHHALVLGQLAFELERVLPVVAGGAGRRRARPGTVGSAVFAAGRGVLWVMGRFIERRRGGAIAPPARPAAAARGLGPDRAVAAAAGFRYLGRTRP